MRGLVACLGAAVLLAGCRGETPPAPAPVTATATSTAAASATSAATLPPGPSVTAPAARRALWGDIWLMPASTVVQALAHIEADTRDGPAELTVIAHAPMGLYRVRLLSGSCTRPGATAGMLGALEVGASGRGTLRTTSVEGAGGVRELTQELLADGDHAVALAGPQGEPAACGEIPTIGVR